LKATFINDWGLNGFSKNVSGTKEKRKMMMSSLVILIGAIAIAFSVTMYAYLMADALESVGYLDLLLMMAGLISVMMVFFTSIYKAQGTLFTSRDYDMLMSLPIKNSVILISKIINLLVFNWIFTAFVLIPTGVIYYTRVSGLS
ncbi:ABC transporter permease, partial [Clostridium saudiense]|nr:ABC transporter permease [Clostridium saudiense]